MEEVIAQEAQEVTAEAEEVKEEVTVESAPAKKPDEEFEKKKQTAQQRINEITREKWQLKRELEAKDAKLKQYEQANVNAGRPIRPNENAFKDEYGTIDYHKYNSEMAKYEDSLLDWRERQRDIRQSEYVVKQQEESKFSAWDAQLEAARDKYENLDEILEKEIYPVDAILEIAANTEPDDLVSAVDIAVYLGQNEKVAKRIEKMSRGAALIELGKIKQDLTSLKKNVSKAPPPISPVDETKGSPSGKKEEDMTDQEWADMRKKERLKKLRG